MEAFGFALLLTCAVLGCLVVIMATLYAYIVYVNKVRKIRIDLDDEKRVAHYSRHPSMNDCHGPRCVKMSPYLIANTIQAATRMSRSIQQTTQH